MKQAAELTRLWGETWEVWDLSEAPALLGAAAEHVAVGKDRILAIPARRVVAAPLWVDSLDPEVIRESVELELEVRGLLPRRKSADAIYSRSVTVDTKTLVICAVFCAEAPEPFEKSVFNRYEASPFLISPVQDGVTLWREGGDLVAAFTRGGSVVYWATLDWPVHSQQIRHWLQMVLLHLTATGVLAARPHRLVLDEALKDSGLAGLIPDVPQEFSLLSPALENANFEWKPESARVLEKHRASTRRTRQVAFALAAIYLVLVLVAGLYLGWLSLQGRLLQGELAQLEEQTAEFSPIVREWRLIGPGAETENYPLETLHRIVRDMPQKGVRLTIYDVTEGRITVEGEAESASLASQFFSSLSKDKDLTHMDWQMPTPALLPNNAARFQLVGIIP